jgi:hypothetical protein
MRTVEATRYVTPLREGGSLPAIVEADDCGLYVVKFRAAGQGVKALIAELIAGELARAAGFDVPAIVLVSLDDAIGRNEPDPEIRDLVRASAGLNLGLDYLPGSLSFDPVVGPAPGAGLASEIVWFDALVTNVDRTAKNPNLLWLIDHGAALYFHHDWADPEAASRSAFAPIREHVLLPWAADIAGAGERLSKRLTRETVASVLARVPEAWLYGESRFASPAEYRAAYAAWFDRRLAATETFTREAERAHGALV